MLEQQENQTEVFHLKAPFKPVSYTHLDYENKSHPI